MANTNNCNNCNGCCNQSCQQNAQVTTYAACDTPIIIEVSKNSEMCQNFAVLEAMRRCFCALNDVKTEASICHFSPILNGGNTYEIPTEFFDFSQYDSEDVKVVIAWNGQIINPDSTTFVQVIRSGNIFTFYNYLLLNQGKPNRFDNCELFFDIRFKTPIDLPCLTTDTTEGDCNC